MMLWKRLIDIIFSLIILIFVFPIVYVICGLIIKITSKGPIIFVQTRVGKDGKPFRIYKFRTMYLNYDEEHDDDIIPFGHIMRKTHVDEIPQVINVLKNDMSLVGPRPHTLKDTEDFSMKNDKYNERLAMKPGITGLAQVNGFCGKITNIYHLDKRIQYDIYYVNNWSLWLDFHILTHTFKHFADPQLDKPIITQWRKQTIDV